MGSASDSFVVTQAQQQADLEMAAYDLWGTRAHLRMLSGVGVVPADELQTLLAAMKTIEGQIESKTYQIDPSLGAQLTLEKGITEIVGPNLGGKVHTGRSRNDQVITAQRLHTRERLLEALEKLHDLLAALLTLAAEHVEMVMPGYTHMQPAKPTTVAHWCLAYVDMLWRDVERLEQTLERWDACPLGAAESYGTSWPLDRASTAELLGFARVQEVTADVTSSRGEQEAEILSDLAFVSLHLSKMAQDLLLYNTYEYGYVELGGAVAQRMGKVTGSSIMPQKKNPDVLELLRAHASRAFGLLLQTFEVLKALPLGYNRDGRETKETVLDGLATVESDVVQMTQVLLTLQFKPDRMREAVIKNYSLSTDLADYLAQRFGIPYRIAYQAVGRTVDQLIPNSIPLAEGGETLAAVCEAMGLPQVKLTPQELAECLQPEVCLQRRTHIGGTASAETRRLIVARNAKLEQSRRKIKTVREALKLTRANCA
jgi:argininosuccinate lyase